MGTGVVKEFALDAEKDVNPHARVFDPLTASFVDAAAAASDAARPALDGLARGLEKPALAVALKDGLYPVRGLLHD